MLSEPEFKEKIIDEIAQATLKDLFSPGCRFYIVLDKDGNDVNLLESRIIDAVESDSSRVYLIDFTEFPKRGQSISQIFLSLIFLKSEFAKDLCTCAEGPLKEILRILIERNESQYLRTIVIKFLECRSCNEYERKRLGVDYDLSDVKKSEYFFCNAIRLYYRKLNIEPIFFFRNLPIEKLPISGLNALRFIDEVCMLPTRFIITGRYRMEYMFLRLEDEKARVFRIETIDSEKAKQIVRNVCNSPSIRSSLPFTDVSLLLFGLKLVRLFGQKITVSALFQALVDLAGHVHSNNLSVIAPSTVQDFFSTLKVKIGLPEARSPEVKTKQYFKEEMERFEVLATKRGYDPAYYLPKKFDIIRDYIVNGDLIYRSDKDIFEPLRYLADFKKINRLLWSLGYKYDGRSRSWVRRF